MADDIFYRLQLPDQSSPNQYDVTSFVGREALGRPFRYDIEFLADSADLDLNAMVTRRGILQLDVRGHDHRIKGVVWQAEFVRALPYHKYLYRIALVPRLQLMQLSRQNQIYGTEGETTIPEIVAQELKGDVQRADVDSPRLLDSDFEFRLDRPYAKRDYIVQYRESDFDFVSRLLEHVGICYFFQMNTPDGAGEKVIFADSKAHHPDIPHGGQLEYRDAADGFSPGDFVVTELRPIARPVPSRVTLKDYNYRTPNVALKVDETVDQSGFGVVVLYGDHFRNMDEGKALAHVRAEEAACLKETFEGISGCCHVAPGYRFKVRNHIRPAFDQMYLCIEATHRGNKPMPGVAVRDVDGVEQPGYEVRFTAIPADRQFRPARVTPKPRLHGVMHGHIDSETLTSRAELDSQGRYKVVIPFDLSGRSKGKGSRYIRMAQPYGGSGQGMHFPLLKGTEVIWTCIDGDPDRPIIIGTVPNPTQPSVVTQSNYRSNVVRTTSGINMEFFDGTG
jgi:type VI secretion system VgrG family protein